MGLSPIFGKLGTSPASESSRKSALLVVGIANDNDLALRYYKPGARKSNDVIDVPNGVNDEATAMDLIKTYEDSAAKGGWELKVSWPLMAVWARTSKANKTGVVYTCRTRITSALDFGPQIDDEYVSRDANPSRAWEMNGEKKLAHDVYGKWQTTQIKVEASVYEDMKG